MRATLSAEAVIEYGKHVSYQYRQFAGIPKFTGCVAEAGPGDNDVVAWNMLAHGAKEVHLVDRFAPRRDFARDAAVRRIAAQNPVLAAILPGAVARSSGLHRHTGLSAEDYFAATPGAFDAIFSCAVLEHVADPIGTLSAMAQALRPGGVMVHFVDLRDHGMFAGMPQLTFLTVPDWLWPRMTANSGRPNRVGIASYRDWLAGSGLESALTITLLTGSDTRLDVASVDEAPDSLRAAAREEIMKVRQSLAPSLRSQLESDLAVAGFCLVARRPEASARQAFADCPIKHN